MDAATNVSIGIAFVAGFLSFISPCVLPLIPAYISYLTGRAAMQTSAESTRELSRSLSIGTAGGAGVAAVSIPTAGIRIRVGTLVHGLFFVAGFTFVFVVFGLLTTASVQVLQERSYDIQRFIARAGGIV